MLINSSIEHTENLCLLYTILHKSIQCFKNVKIKEFILSNNFEYIGVNFK